MIYMITIVLHSSKTMRQPDEFRRVNDFSAAHHTPLLHDEAILLATYLKKLTLEQLQQVMKISEVMAEKVHLQLQAWNESAPTLPAIDAFLGDIYSGLQVQQLSKEDRAYAHEHLYILSGLYGVLRALDEIQPYRLEMGYKLLGNSHDISQPNITSLYSFWGDRIARAFPNTSLIVNLSAVEYTKAVFSHFRSLEAYKGVTIVSPKFLTVSPKSGAPQFVTVHAKIARGAYARWLIQQRVQTLDALRDFSELGYRYDASLSTPTEPVFVAEAFQGLGLSVRLSERA